MSAGFQRSSMSFRRQGSSGLVWDDKFLDTNHTESHNESSDGNDNALKDDEKTDHRSELRPSRSVGSISMIQGGRSNSSKHRTATSYHASATKVASPPRTDPPSPKVRGCGFFGIFSNPKATGTPRSYTDRTAPVVRMRKSKSQNK